MAIQMGGASSHGPSLFFSTYAGWEKMHHRLNDDHPQPPETELETEDVITERVPRIQADFARQKQAYSDFKPDAIVTVLGDQREWFDASNIPNLLVYTGPDTWTVHNTGIQDEEPAPDPFSERFRLPVKTDQDLARTILASLIEQGFDAAHTTEMQPQSQPKRGVPHGVGNVLPHTHPDLEVPIVPVFVNVDDGPPAILNGQRCLELGRSIARACLGTNKRILITGSGGMSHNPRGLRSGWVDQPQDEWFLQQMRDGNAAALSSMFSFRSELFNSGAGEMRTWIVVAAAMDFMKPSHKAEWSDYIPTRKLTNGSGWVLYPPISNEDVEARRSEVLAAV